MERTIVLKSISECIESLVFCDKEDEVLIQSIEYKIAGLYYSIGQWSSAFSFFMRASGRKTNLKDIKYNSLLFCCLCLLKQGNRLNSAKALALHAINLMNSRPEAYFIISKIYMELKMYLESYTIVNDCIDRLSIKDFKPIEPLLEYPGFYGLVYQLAISSWYVGRSEQCRIALQKIKHMKDVDIEDAYKTSIQDIMSRIGSTKNTFTMYNKNSDFEKLKVKFNGSDTIESNFSQTYQDLFVLTMLNGKSNGVFLEVGAADPFYGSNTALLEQKFGWNGISIDIKEEEIAKFKGKRNCTAIVKDALCTNYDKLLSAYTDVTDIDYLQLDCEPPENTLKILLSIPFEKYRFAVITFEHDYFCDFNGTVREKSRAILHSHGYELVVSDVAPDDRGTYEDWWVHPELVHTENKDKIKNVTNQVNRASDILLYKK